MEVVKQPASVFVWVQVLLVPALALSMAFTGTIYQDSLVLQAILLHGIMVLAIHQSNIRIASLSSSALFFVLLIFGVALMLVLMLFNYFFLRLTIYSQLLTIPACILVAAMLSTFKHFPGSRSLVESQNMVYFALFALLCLEHFIKKLSSPAASANYFRVATSESVVLDIAVLLVLVTLPASFFALKISKSVYKTHHRLFVYTYFGFVLLICVYFVFMSVSYGYYGHLVLFLRYRPTMDDARTIRDYCMVITVFVIFKSIIFWVVNSLHCVNIYYNRVHRALYQAFTRKSYHALMIAFVWASRRAPHLFYLVSSVAIYFLCFIEALRPKSAAFGFFYRNTAEFVSDSTTQTAINHIYLLATTALFPAASHVFGNKIPILKYASVATVLIADAMGQIVPAVWFSVSKSEPYSWVDIASLQMVCIPLYSGWTMPNVQPDIGFQHDIDLVVKLDLHSKDLFKRIAVLLAGEYQYTELPEEFGSLKITRTSMHTSSQALALLRKRTFMGTAAFAMSQLLTLLSVRIGPFLSLFASSVCAAYEMIGDCDNCMTAVICALFFVIYSAVRY